MMLSLTNMGTGFYENPLTLTPIMTTTTAVGGQHHNLAQLQQQMMPIPLGTYSSSSSSSSSSASSSSSSSSTSSESSTCGGGGSSLALSERRLLLQQHNLTRPSMIPDVSDDELARLSVRQLNQRLQGQDRGVVTALKQKRRTLKNRGYAFNCRIRRIQTQMNLETENRALKQQIDELRTVLGELHGRLSFYEQTLSSDSSSSTSSSTTTTTTTTTFA